VNALVIQYNNFGGLRNNPTTPATRTTNPQHRRRRVTRALHKFLRLRDPVQRGMDDFNERAEKSKKKKKVAGFEHGVEMI
jgi:hypothetical protein